MDIQLKDLEAKDGKYKCPVCGEFELQEITVWGEDFEDSPGTGEYVCHVPDCLQSYGLNSKGYLISTWKTEPMI